MRAANRPADPIVSASDWSGLDALDPAEVAPVADAVDDAAAEEDPHEEDDDDDASLPDVEPFPAELPMFISSDIRSGAKPPLLLGVINEDDDAVPAFALAALASVALSVEKAPPLPWTR